MKNTSTPPGYGIADDVMMDELCTCGHQALGHYWDGSARKHVECSWCDCVKFTLAKVCPLCKHTIGG